MNKEKIINFVLKYRVIVFLVIIILILLIIMVINKKPDEETIINQNQPTPSSQIINITTNPTITDTNDSLDFNSDQTDSTNFPLSYLLPYEEKDFKVVKYLKKNVLLVNPKVDIEKAKVSLKKWLDLVEEKPGENIIVWQ